MHQSGMHKGERVNVIFGEEDEDSYQVRLYVFCRKKQCWFGICWISQNIDVLLDYIDSNFFYLQFQGVFHFYSSIGARDKKASNHAWECELRYQNLGCNGRHARGLTFSSQAEAVQLNTKPHSYHITYLTALKDVSKSMSICLSSAHATPGAHLRWYHLFDVVYKLETEMRVISRVQLCRMLNCTCLFDIVAAAVLKLCQDSTYSPIWSYLYDYPLVDRVRGDNLLDSLVI